MDQTQLMLEGEGDARQLLRRIGRICKKGRWLIAFGSLITVLVVTAVLSFLPSKYRSDATILIVEQEISTSLVAPLSTVTASQKLTAIAEEVLSQSRLLEIIAKFKLFSNQPDLSPERAVALMRQSIDIAPIDPKMDQFSAFSISFSAGSAKLAQDVTKTLCSVFIERNQEKQKNQVEKTKNFINEQVAEKHARLASIEQRMQAFKTAHAGELPEDRASNEGRLQDARSQFETASASLGRARGQRAIWETALTDSLNIRLSQLKRDKEALLKNYTPQHRDVIAKDEQIGQLEAAITAAKTGTPLPQAVVASADSNISQLQGQLQANALEIDSLTGEQARQTKRIADYERRLGATASFEEQLASMTRESNELSSDVSEVLKKEQATGMAVDAERVQPGGQFKQLDPPSLPDHPSSPPRMRIALIAAVLGALLGLVLSFIVDLRKSVFHGEDELRERFGPPLLLSIPALLTRQEQRARSWKIGFEVVAGSIVTLAIVAVEVYVYGHP
jgi:succinoglycan biosynthesis transport protein ExoP